MSFIDFLSEFSYQRIIIGTTLIGACAGAMGVFLYLRRQSLLSDVIGSAATPGVMGIFLAVSLSPLLFDARSMPVITIGAMVTGLLAAVLANRISATTPGEPHRGHHAYWHRHDYGRGDVAVSGRWPGVAAGHSA